MKLIYFGTIPSLFVATTTTTTSVSSVTPQAVFAAKLQHVAKEKLKDEQYGDLLEDYNTLLTHPDTLTNFHDRYVLSLFIVLCEASQQSADPTTPQVHVQLNTACRPIPDTHTEFAKQRITKTLEDSHHPQIGRNARLEIMEAIRANNFTTSGKWYVEQAGILFAGRRIFPGSSLTSPPSPINHVTLCTTIAMDIPTLSPELVQEKARLMYDYVCRDIPETNRDGDSQGIKRLKIWIRSSVSRVFVEALPADLASAEEAKTMIRVIWNSFIAPPTVPSSPVPDINTIPRNVFNALRVLALNSDKITVAEFTTEDDVCVNLAPAFRDGKTSEYLGFVSVEFFAHLCHRGSQPDTSHHDVPPPTSSSSSSTGVLSAVSAVSVSETGHGRGVVVSAHHRPAAPVHLDLQPNRAAVISAWNRYLDSPFELVGFEPGYIRNAIILLRIGGGSIPPFDSNISGEFELCKYLKRSIIRNPRLVADHEYLMNSLCDNMPLRFLDSRIPWQRNLEDFLFHLWTQAIPQRDPFESSTDAHILRRNIMDVWNSIHSPTSRLGDLVSNKLIQYALTLLYLSGQEDPLNATDRFDNIHMCQKFRDEVTRRGALGLQRVNFNPNDMTDFMHSVCHDLGDLNAEVPPPQVGETKRQEIMRAIVSGNVPVSQDADVALAQNLFTGRDMSGIRDSPKQQIILCRVLAQRIYNSRLSQQHLHDANQMMDRVCRDVPVVYTNDSEQMKKLKRFVYECLKDPSTRDASLLGNASEAVNGVLAAWNNIFVPDTPIVPEGQKVPQVVFDSLRVLLMSINPTRFPRLTTKEELCQNMARAVDRAVGYVPFPPESLRAFLCDPPLAS